MTVQVYVRDSHYDIIMAIESLDGFPDIMIKQTKVRSLGYDVCYNGRVDWKEFIIAHKHLENLEFVGAHTIEVKDGLEVNFRYDEHVYEIKGSLSDIFDMCKKVGLGLDDSEGVTFLYMKG